MNFQKNEKKRGPSKSPSRLRKTTISENCGDRKKQKKHKNTGGRKTRQIEVWGSFWEAKSHPK